MKTWVTKRCVTVHYFHKKAPSYMFDRVANTFPTLDRKFWHQLLNRQPSLLVVIFLLDTCKFLGLLNLIVSFLILSCLTVLTIQIVLLLILTRFCRLIFLNSCFQTYFPKVQKYRIHTLQSIKAIPFT